MLQCETKRLWVFGFQWAASLFSYSFPSRLYTRLVVTKQQLDWDDWTAIVLGVS